MEKHGPSLSSAALAAALVVLATTGIATAAPTASSSSTTAVHETAAPRVELAQAEGTEPRELQPRYEPAQPQPEGGYNDEYIFGITRSVADSTMHPAVVILKVPGNAVNVDIWSGVR
jgi:hypothetical protein